MEKPKTYCQAVTLLASDSPHIFYHDKEYGFPLQSDNELLGRLILEINQAGLSWTTILKKKDNFYKAYDQFDIQKIARYTQTARARLLSDAGIIRNKLKVNAAIVNAQRVEQLQNEFGSFSNWLDHHHPMTRENWVKLFKQEFIFTGGEITNEFLMSTGYLRGAHEPSCPVYEKVLEQKPRWLKSI